MIDEAQIRLALQKIQAMRQQAIQQYDALYQEIAALLPDDVPSFQVPLDYRKALQTDLEKLRRRHEPLSNANRLHSKGSSR